MAQWYFSQGGQQRGPVEQQELQRMLSAGQVGPNDLVWREGMGDWQPARAVAELAYPGPAATPGYTVAPGYAPAPGTPGGQYPAGAYPQAGYPAGPINYYTPQTLVQYAGFWQRFVAAVVDGLIIGIPFFLVGLAVDRSFGEDPDQISLTHALLSLLIGLGRFVASWLYEALMISSPRMATVGKGMMKIRVTDLTGQRVSFGRASGRYFGKILSTLTLLIGYIMAAFTQRKQALHDLMAGTVVIKNEQV